MPSLKSIINLGFQTITTFIVLFCIYMIYALFDYKGGFPNFIGLITFQPLFALIISFITICVTLFFGLPIRLHNKLNIWWKKRFWIQILGIVSGLFLCFLSFFFIDEYTTRMEGMETTHEAPNLILSATGWFLISFCLMHFYVLDFLKIITRKLNFHI